MSAPWSVEDLVQRKAYLLHNETGVVGRAKQFYPPNTYASPILGDLGAEAEKSRRVTSPCLELDTGDVFVVKPDAFTPLSEREVAVYESAVKMVSTTITIVLRQAKAAKVELGTAALLMLSCMRVSSRSLDLEVRKAIAKGEKDHV